MELKRYRLHWSEMRPDNEGEWVRHEVAVALQAQLDVLKGKLDATTILREGDEK